MLREICKISDELLIDHRHYKKITSTQDYAKKIPLSKNVWQLITAEQQTCGKGQMGQRWISEKSGNIYATLIIPLHRQHVFSSIMLPQIVAFSIIQILRSKGFNAKLKWVNDVFIEKKKIAGILCEQSLDINLGLQKLLIGIGINVNASEKMLVKLDKAATSLFVESKQHIDEKNLLYQIINMIYQNFKVFLAAGFKYFSDQINNLNLLEFKDSLVYLCLKENLTAIRGKLICLNNDGSLKLDLGEGKIQNFNRGRLII